MIRRLWLVRYIEQKSVGFIQPRQTREQNGSGNTEGALDNRRAYLLGVLLLSSSLRSDLWLDVVLILRREPVVCAGNDGLTERCNAMLLLPGGFEGCGA